MKKFELTTDFINAGSKKLFRIKALINFGDVTEGELGGYIEKEENLSQTDNAWVYGDARVYDNAWVYGDARVYDNAWVCDNVWVYGDALVYEDALICGNARVYGDAKVCGKATVCGDAKVYGSAMVCGDADYTTITGFGTHFRTTTFFRCTDGEVRVSCGCFHGTISEFREQVKKTRVGKIAKEYLMIADLMELHFKQGDNNDE